MRLSILLLFFFFLISPSNLQAQQMITGQVENWNNSEAKIMFVDPFSGYTREVGEISENGFLSIPLEKDFLTIIKTEMENEQENASENMKISLKNVKKTYSCQVGELNYENPETKLSGLPKQLYVVTGEREMLGLLMPASNRAIAEYHTSFGDKNAVKGKYLEWVYLDEEAQIKGDCYSHGFTDNSTFKENHHYDLNLEQGWNLIQHEITETLEDESGKVYPKEVEWSSIDTIPSNIEWYLIPRKR